MAQLKDTTVNGMLTVNGQVNAPKQFGIFGQFELISKTPYIDFHYNNSTADHTARIIHQTKGRLDYTVGQYGTIVQDGDAGYVYPSTSGAYGLGTPDNRWYDINLKNSPNVSSLVELKENIRPFTTALEEIDKTDVYNYNLKACLERDGEDVDHTGFVIGEGYNISNLLLGHGGDGIDIYNAIGVAFGGVKELYEKVKIQKNKITELENENKEIKEEIALLKAHLGL